MSQKADKVAPVIIVGGGHVGLTTALACAHNGIHVTLIDAADPQTQLAPEFDGRASSISASSYEIFRHLGLAKHLDKHAQPILDILVADGQAGYPASPLTLHFDSAQTGGAPMGYMVENRHLRYILLAAVRTSALIDLIAPARVKDYLDHSSGVSVQLDDGRSLRGRVLIAADGRGSFLRQKAGIYVDEYKYQQASIVTTVAHEKPHNATAHELFLAGGPFAILPMTGQRSSIVWSDHPDAVSAAMALPEAAFMAELSRRFGDMYGALSLAAPRWSYPLTMQLAQNYRQGRLALIGDAAHGVHPIAGQGMNMGLRDAAVIAEVMREAMALGLDPASQLDVYARWRHFDNNSLAASMDVLARFFSNDIAPLRHLRRLGLGLVDQAGPAKVFFMREAAGQLGTLPPLLRPDDTSSKRVVPVRPEAG